MNIFFLTTLSFILCWLLIKINLSFLNKIFLDIPNIRSAHEKGIPNSGGLIIISVLLLISLINNNPYFFSILPLSIVGFLDDRFNLPRILRYIAQCLTTILIINQSDFHLFLATQENFFNFIILYSLFIIIGTSIINFINFMDGLDGLVTGSTLIILIASSIIFQSYIFFPIISALIGFLVWNWSPAKIFMGDTGSMLIGSLLVWIIFNTSSFGNSLSIILISMPLLGDAFICVIRRWIAGQNIFNSHSLHLYQRLYKRGISQSKISFLYTIITLLLSISYFSLGLIGLIVFNIITIFLYNYLDRKIAEPFPIRT